MVGMSIGEHSPGTNLYHQVCRFQHRNLKCRKERMQRRRDEAEIKNKTIDNNISDYPRVRGKEERVETRHDNNALNLTDKAAEVHERVSICRMYLQRGDGGDVLETSLLIFQVVSLWSLVPLAHLPQFDGLIFVERESTAQKADKNRAFNQSIYSKM